MTATITGLGAGETVDFEVISGPNDFASGTSITNASGQATFTYTSNGDLGTDEIRACYTDDNDVTICSETVIKVWNEDSTVVITLDPRYDLNPVGQLHRVTATVTERGVPVENEPVTFSILSGPRGPGSDPPTYTNEDGEATYGYFGYFVPSNRGLGIDRIQAWIQDGEVCSTVVEKEWVEEVIDLDPDFATNPVGTNHTVTATIVDTLGNPVPGVLVTFTVLAGPNAGDSGMGTTNASGEVGFAYSGDGGPGMDVIEACFTNAAGTEVCTFDDAYKEWTETPPTLPPQQVPGVTDWGAIVFAVLLLGSAIWMLRRRRNLE